MHRRLISIAIALSLNTAFAGDAPSPSQTPSTAIAPFSRATPESVGLDSAQLTKMLSYLQTPGFDMESIIIARHGKVVLEAYVAPFHAGIPHQVNSVTKSFMATLIGMLIADGKLKLTDTVADIDRRPCRGIGPGRLGQGESTDYNELDENEKALYRICRSLAILLNKQVENPWKKHDNLPL